MYAVKPWGRVFFVGRTVGSLTLGIGMRWRESEVEIVDRVQDPYGEMNNFRRCVMPENTLKHLEDLGVSRFALERIVAPARKWKFVTTASVELLREGETFAGCSPLERVVHVSEGKLIRALRTEFMRFGGSFCWGSEAYDAFEAHDGSGTYTLRKQFGAGAEAQAVLGFCNNEAFNKQLLVEDVERLAVLFDVRTGVVPQPSQELLSLFGSDFDVVIAVGRGVALHMWQTTDLLERPVVAWRLVCKGRSDYTTLLQQIHPTLRSVLASSIHVEEFMTAIPATTPAIRDDAHHHRLSVLGDALLPVDPFEWRGDNARVAIEEASALCRAIFGKKYHRGDMPHILRSAEQDFITRRAFLLRRDLLDAEHFLAVHPELPYDEDADVAPQLKRVGV